MDVYVYLEPDVAQWLRENAPKPRHGNNYHQWLSSQYGLQKLVQHIWQVIGMAKSCENINELKQAMAKTFGSEPIQLTLKIPKSNVVDRKKTLPKCVGMGKSGISDLSERVDELLWKE